jgi:hypothetical protein
MDLQKHAEPHQTVNQVQTLQCTRLSAALAKKRIFPSALSRINPEKLDGPEETIPCSRCVMRLTRPLIAAFSDIAQSQYATAAIANQDWNLLVTPALAGVPSRSEGRFVPLRIRDPTVTGRPIARGASAHFLARLTSDSLIVPGESIYFLAVV